LIRWNWRGAKATELLIHDETMPVKGGAIRLRICTPQGSGPFPVLQFFHGGGWAFGDAETHDAVCRDLCVQGRRVVIAVDYRLAPEYPFPIPVEDCLASVAWIVENAGRLAGKAESLVLCGDSAGGNLAAVVAQQARELLPGLIKGQILIYPVTDHCAHASWSSYQSHGGMEFGLTLKGMTALWDMYLRGSHIWLLGMTSHKLATPLHATDLSHLPRTLMLIAEEDLLRDEAADYARRLADAGVTTEMRRYAGQQHGFIGLKPSAAYRQAIADIVN
jgi:acetyl esterase